MRKNGHGWVTLPTGEKVYSDTVVEATACTNCKRTTYKDGRPRKFFSYDNGHRPYCNITCYHEDCRKVAEKLLRLTPAGLQKILAKHGLNPDSATCGLILAELCSVQEPVGKEKSDTQRANRKRPKRRSAVGKPAPRRTARNAALRQPVQPISA